MNNLITITTDFGDAFAAAQLKAVILAFGFTGQIIENHSVTKYSITEGAFQIRTLVKYCPKNSIHVGVVDPGVGSKRRGLIIKTRQSYFIGPDNGVLYPAADDAGIEKVWKINEYYFGEISRTFHGRDVFVKCAAHIAKDKKPEDFGCVEVNKISICRLKFKYGQVLHVDDYGNIKVHFPKEFNKNKTLSISKNGKKVVFPLVKTFSDVNPGNPLAYKGSSNTLELAVNLGDAAKSFNIKNEEILAIE